MRNSGYLALLNCHALIKNHAGFICFILLMSVFRSAVADWNDVPTGSMQPTIVEGDRVYIDKLAYDVNLPFAQVSLVKVAEPQAGEIAVFNSAVSNKRLIKRVIAVPGDTVAMLNNRLLINGQPLNYQLISQTEQEWIWQEASQANTHLIKTRKGGSSLDSFHSVVVPAGQYLMMGDNRDSSADSRVIGFVPRHEFIGRAESIVLSFDYDDYYLPRKDRWFKKLM
ncbi:signal peptidase I [Saccharobesus litoralis]|uniref:Signal peptidase I n=1 Tax=Saccharobesus litoralis TaxID=2172099 RepID=A0A2S0VQN7_9ALTE|nr:signal peptidase I [Saccharobesus litoralis]AWB66527.1 signal peptidase I [Saccharobesus litoralis]